MSAPPYMKLYVGDYLGDTHHLSALEHGAYLLLLMAMWRAGGSLPASDDNLAKLARCSPAEWQRIRDTILAFFRRSRGRITHKRLSAEIAKYEDISRKRSGAVQAREAKKASKDNTKASSSDGSFDAELMTKPEPEPEPKKEPPKPPTLSGFDAWWQAYPRKVAKGSARKAYATALRKTSAENLLAALDGRQWPSEERFIPHPATWLNGECWDDGSGMQRIETLSQPEDPWPRRMLNWRRNAYWNSEWGPKPGKEGCRVPLEHLAEPRVSLVTEDGKAA